MHNACTADDDVCGASVSRPGQCNIENERRETRRDWTQAIVVGCQQCKREHRQDAAVCVPNVDVRIIGARMRERVRYVIAYVRHSSRARK